MHQLFFKLLLLLLPTQIGFHFWPDWAMVLGRRVDYLAPTIYLTDILIVITLISWFFESRGRFLISNFKFLILKLTLALLFIGVNIFVAANKLEAAYKWLKVLEFAALGWYIVKTKPTLSAITYPLSLGVLYTSFIAIFQFFLQHSIGGPFWFLGERTFTADTPGIARISWGKELLRPYATFPHPNVLGGFLAITLPLLIYKWKKTYYKLTTILGVLALILTFSRSAWIAGVLGISLMKRKIFLPLLLILFILAFQFNVNEESVVIRQQLNSVAISMWQQSPLFGVGLGNFLVKLPSVLVSREVYFLQPVHNIYLLLLAETGIIGLAFFLWLLWVIGKRAIRDTRYVTRKNKNVLYITYHISLITLLLLGLVDHYPITLQQGQLLLTILLVLK